MRAGPSKSNVSSHGGDSPSSAWGGVLAQSSGVGVLLWGDRKDPGNMSGDQDPQGLVSEAGV